MVSGIIKNCGWLHFSGKIWYNSGKIWYNIAIKSIVIDGTEAMPWTTMTIQSETQNDCEAEGA